MKISVVLIVRNEATRIRECLLSLINQKGIDDNEIIVVDGNSSDNTTDIVNDFVQKYKFIRLIECSTCGYSFQRNIGVSVAQGEYILYISGDTVVEPTLIQQYLQALKDGYDVIQGTIINIPNKGIFSYYMAKLFPIFYTPYANTIYEQFSTVNVLVRKKLLLDNPFDEKLSSLEDKGWLLLFGDSVTFLRLRKAIVFHVVHETLLEYCKKIYKEAFSLGKIITNPHIKKENINIFNWISWVKKTALLIGVLFITFSIFLYFNLALLYYIGVGVLFLFFPFLFLSYHLVQLPKTSNKIIPAFILYLFFLFVITGFIKGYVSKKCTSIFYYKI